MKSEQLYSHSIYVPTTVYSPSKSYVLNTALPSRPHIFCSGVSTSCRELRGWNKTRLCETTV